MASSTARRFSTGRAPGKPRHTGQTLVLGGAPKLVGHPQKILVRVESWTWTSSPITDSYLAIKSGSAILDVMPHYKGAIIAFFCITIPLNAAAADLILRNGRLWT